MKRLFLNLFLTFISFVGFGQPIIQVDRYSESNPQDHQINIDSAFSSRLRPRVYFNTSFERIRAETDYQLSQIEIIVDQEGFETPSDHSNKAWQETAVSRARVESKLSELSYINNKGSFAGEEIVSFSQFFSTADLRDIQHRLYRSTTKLTAIPNYSELGSFRLIQDLLVEVNIELKDRGVYNDGDSYQSQEFTQLRQRRFELIDRLNKLAIEDAILLSDNSLELPNLRRELAEVEAEIRDIDRIFNIEEDLLPTRRNLLLAETQQERLAIFNYSKQSVEAQYNIKRHYATYEESLIVNLEAYIANEERHIINRQKEATLWSNGLRGPPSSPKDFPSLDFDVSPKPPSPIKPNNAGIGLSFDDFLTPKDLEKLQKKSAKEAQKVFERFNQRYIAGLSLDQTGISWKRFNPYKSNTVPSLNSEKGYWRGLTSQFYQKLSTDPGSAIRFGAELDVALADFPEMRDNPAKLLGNNINAYDQLADDIQKGINSRVERMALMKDFAPTYLQDELNELKAAKENILGAKKEAKARISSGLAANPPPIPEHTEDFHLKYILESKRRLNSKIASYGFETPGGITYQWNKLNQVLNTHEAAIAIGNFQKISNNRTEIQLLQYLADKELLPLDVYEDFWESKLAEEQASSRLMQAIENSRKTNPEAAVSARLKNKLAAANELLSKANSPKQLPSPAEYRIKQTGPKVGQINNAKAPGGIWLTPEKMTIAQCEIQAIELVGKIRADKECPIDHSTWKLNDQQIICFPLTSQPNPNSNLLW